MESVSGMAAASGGSEQRLLQCFRESTGSILQLFELQQWWRQGDSKGKEEEVEVRASDILIEPWLSPYVPSCVCFSLQQLLQQLVERGEVGCRVLTARGSQYTMYWLKKQYDAGLSSTPLRTPSQSEKTTLTPMSVSLRERLKRSRPRFVSPLLSSAKKPRLAVAVSGRPPVGKLDFTGCDKSSSGVTKKLEDSEKTKEEKNLKSESPQKAQEKERTSKNQSSETSEGEEGRTSGVKEEDSSNGDRRTCSVGAVTAVGSISEGGGSGEGGVELLVAERGFLESKLREEEERLRKLRMVKLYRTKNDLRQLDSLIQKWRDVMQEAAETLLASSTLQPLPSMAQLLDYLHIDQNIIHYSAEDEAFY